MTKLRILVAIEPRSYREAVSGTLKELRPSVEVLVVEPEKLDREVKRSGPGLVLCSHLTPSVRNRAAAWVEFYPNGERLVAMSIDGLHLTAIDELGLHNLLWVVDRAELLAQKGSEHEKQ